jgi:hypothetical protein
VNGRVGPVLAVRDHLRPRRMHACDASTCMACMAAAKHKRPHYWTTLPLQRRVLLGAYLALRAHRVLWRSSGAAYCLVCRQPHVALQAEQSACSWSSGGQSRVR